MVGSAAYVAADLLLHPLAGRMKRDPRRWVFGHQLGAFEGNPKFLFLWLLNQSDVEPHWITGNVATWLGLRRRNLPVSLRWSPQGIWLVLTAGAVFVAHRSADVNASLIRGALLVNLWHGVGLKAIQLGWGRGKTAQSRSKRASLLRRARDRTYLIDPDLVVTTSPFMQDHFSGQFGLPPGRCPVLGYPRLDAATNEVLLARSKAFDVPADFALRPAGIAAAFVYAPTSRDSNRPLLRAALPDLARLERLLAERRAVLYVKLHPQTFEQVPEGYDHIRPWPPSIDLYNHLHDLDALVSDYSSLLYDYLAIRSDGVAVYAFDLDDYLARDRTLLYPFKDNVAGALATDFSQLCGLLQSDPSSWPVDRAKFESIRDKFWSPPAGTACVEIYDHVRERLDLPRSRSAAAQPAPANVALEVA